MTKKRTAKELIYENIEALTALNKWAVKILKVIAETGKNKSSRWCSITFREWAGFGINTFTFSQVIKWCIREKLVEVKDAPQEGRVGKKRKMYRLKLN